MPSTSVWKQVSFYALTGLASFCLAFCIFNQLYGSSLKHQIQSMTAIRCPCKINDEIEEIDKLNEIQRVIDMQRKIVLNDTIRYQYPNGTYNFSATELEDLAIVKSWNPVRSVVVSTWRSGSSFLGELIGAHPGNFYHFEPLEDWGVVKVRGPPFEVKAMKRIKDLLNCDYAHLQGDYIELDKSHHWVLSKTTSLWKKFTAHNSIYYDHRYIGALCKLFSFQTMKIIRLRLSVAQKLLEDEALAVRLVLLVRDPRGIVQSRRHRSWCQPSPDCADSALFCADMASDYEYAVELLKKYPTTFRVLRYEDLAADSYHQAEELYKFYGRDYHPTVKKFLDGHTQVDTGNSYSTFRNTKKAPYHWKTELKFEEVEEIQRACTTAMKYWGYVPAMNATHQREFNPVTSYRLTNL